MRRTGAGTRQRPPEHAREIELIEGATGMDLATFAREVLFEPLGIRPTQWKWTFIPDRNELFDRRRPIWHVTVAQRKSATTLCCKHNLE